MKKIIQRLVIFFVGIPALFSIIIFLPHYNHLVFNLLVTFFTIIGAMELRNILAQKNLVLSMPEAVVLGALSPAAWTAALSFGFLGEIAPAAFIMGATWLLVSQVFMPAKKLESCAGRIAAGLTVMIYPGLFLAWIIRMTNFREAAIVILVFLFMVFLNDSLAWVTGMLFGKNNRGFIPASPGKSIAGFIGGQTFSVLTGIAAALLFPGLFKSSVMPSLLGGALLGFCTGLAAIFGDLGESAIKRSAGVKDSGFLMMGRGGALDSLDSVAVAAPVYYLLFRLIF